MDLSRMPVWMCLLFTIPALVTANEKCAAHAAGQRHAARDTDGQRMIFFTSGSKLYQMKVVFDCISIPNKE